MGSFSFTTAVLPLVVLLSRRWNVWFWCTVVRENHVWGGGGLENRMCVWFGVACVRRYIYTDRGLPCKAGVCWRGVWWGVRVPPPAPTGEAHDHAAACLVDIAGWTDARIPTVPYNSSMLHTLSL